MRLLSTSVAALLLLGGGQAAFAAAPNPVSAYSLYKAVTFRWTAVQNASSYTVCYSTVSFPNTSCPNPRNVVMPHQRQLTLFNLVNNQVYYFRVKAVTTAGVTLISNQATSIPRAGKLNDTGITTCLNATQSGLPCPVAGFPGQDAQYGRDNFARFDQNGHAGFVFQKISSAGLGLPETATSWNCVRDVVTGLMWEVKTDDGGLHDKYNTYTWYNPDSTSNGGSAGYQNLGSCVGSSCDTDGFVKAVNAIGWCGYKDWRLPNLDELGSIIDLSRTNLSINTSYFPNTVGSWAWSSSPYASSSYYAWIVGFSYGYGSYVNKDYSGSVRLVRGGQ